MWCNYFCLFPPFFHWGLEICLVCWLWWQGSVPLACEHPLTPPLSMVSFFMLCFYFFKAIQYTIQNGNLVCLVYYSEIIGFQKNVQMCFKEIGLEWNIGQNTQKSHILWFHEKYIGWILFDFIYLFQNIYNLKI